MTQNSHCTANTTADLFVFVVPQGNEHEIENIQITHASKVKIRLNQGRNTVFFTLTVFLWCKLSCYSHIYIKSGLCNQIPKI